MAESREEVLSRNAQRFAKSYYDNAALNGAPMVPAERAAFEKGEDAYVDWMARAMYAKMAADPDYTEENWNDAKAARLDKFKDIEGASYAIEGGKSPEVVNYEKGWEKFRPLVENGKWYRMSPSAITLEMTQLGYDNKNEKSRNEFWENLRKYDQDYNKALAVDEFANSGLGKYTSIMTPTAYKEAMEQALTDRPYSVSDVITAHVIDQVRSALVGGTMGLQGVVRPAIGMGLADMLSQYADAATLGHRNFSPEEALSATSAGATIVPGFRVATKWLSRWKSPAANRIGRELYRGAKNYAERDEAAEEVNAIKEQLLRTRKEQGSMTGMMPGTPEYDAAAERLTDMEDKLRLLGFNGRNFSEAEYKKYIDEMSEAGFRNSAPGRFISIDQMLGRGGTPISDEAASKALEDAIGDKFTFNVSRPTLEEAATRLAGRNLGYTSAEMDEYALGKILRDNYGIETAFPGDAMESSISSNAQKLIESGEAANYLDQVLRDATERRAALKGTFPKVSAKFAGETKKQGKTGWSRTGAYAANALGLLSGAKGIDLVSAIHAAGTIGDDRSVFQDKLDAFKQSDWYRNLPEDRKNVIEAAFKKAAEERKKKGK